jgi:hypothetical protein
MPLTIGKILFTFSSSNATFPVSVSEFTSGQLITLSICRVFNKESAITNFCFGASWPESLQLKIIIEVASNKGRKILFVTIGLNIFIEETSLFKHYLLKTILPIE